MNNMGFFNPFGSSGSGGGGGGGSTANYNNLTNKPTINGVTVQGSLTTGDLLITAADVGALPSGTKYGADFALSIDSQTFVVTAQLKDQDGNNLGQAKTIDLPLETMVVGGSYDDTTQKVILTLKNGQTVEFSVADLVSGLQSEITLSNKLDADLIDDSESINKFVTAAEKAAWNKSVSYMSIPNNGDLNDYYGAENAGNYLCTDANVSTLSHKPSAITTAFRMDVIFYNDQTIQVIYPNDEKCISFLRIYKNNTWSEWKESAIEMTILSYGNSTWDEFMKAYLLNSIVYCRAGSSTPQTSPQLRLAFMAYVNDEANPTEVEFQYYRSVSNKSDSAQGDEVYVYKLNKTNGWSNLKRNAYSKIAVAAPITKSYASGTITLSHADSGVTAGTYDSVTVDAKGHVTAGSNYTTSQAEQDAEIAVIANAGAKNLFKNTAVSKIYQSTTFTVNEDGTVSLSGTAASAVSLLELGTVTPPAGSYIVSGCPSGGSWSPNPNKYRIRVAKNRSWVGDETGNGLTVTVNGSDVISLQINIGVGVDTAGLVFKPMLRPASITDDTFVPYAPTNRELYETKTEQTETNVIVNLGAKNLFEIREPITSTRNNVTFVVNADGTVDVSTTSDGASAQTDLSIGTVNTYKGITYKLTGCPSGVTGLCACGIGGTGSVIDTGSGALLTPTVDGSRSPFVRVFNGAVITTPVKFYPMIRRAEITDDTFVPYAKTNRELTVAGDEDRAALIAQVDGGSKNGFNILATPTAYHTSYTISGDTLSAVASGNYARVSFPCVFKSGKNIFKCTVSNRVVVGGNIQIRFSKNADGSGLLSNSITIEQNGDVYSEISVSADTDGYITFYLNASGTSYGNSADFSEIMLCTAADYAISPAFVPYRPSWQEMMDIFTPMTQAEYDALTTKDKPIYFVYEE